MTFHGNPQTAKGAGAELARCVCEHVRAHHTRNRKLDLYLVAADACAWGGCGCPRFVSSEPKALTYCDEPFCQAAGLHTANTPHTWSPS